MPTKLGFGRDIQGFNTFARAPSSNKFSATLVAATHSTITVPSSAANWIAYFSYETPTANIWVAVNGTAAVPAAGTFAATTSERNPQAYLLKAGDVIDLISADATVDVGVALYEV